MVWRKGCDVPRVCIFRGRVLPDGYISQVAKEVKALDSNIKLHVDGARVWNAAISLGKSVAHVTAGADSVQVCLSKGFCRLFDIYKHNCLLDTQQGLVHQLVHYL